MAALARAEHVTSGWRQATRRPVLARSVECAGCGPVLLGPSPYAVAARPWHQFWKAGRTIPRPVGRLWQ